jgi:dUTP pyrophosphatase
MDQIFFQKLSDNAKQPYSDHEDDAGYDLFSAELAVLPPRTRKLISTDICIEIPIGFYGRIAPRSGLAYKNGIDVLAGVIDARYRGIVGVILYNTDGEKTFSVEIGDRIAQLIIEPYVKVPLIESATLSETSRGGNGYGSTGIK